MGSIDHLRTRALALAASLEARSHGFVARLPEAVERLVPWWVVAFMVLAALRMTFALTPVRDFPAFAEIFLPYALIALAPLVGLRLAYAAYPKERRVAQPWFRFTLIGRWKQLDPDSAARHRLYGPAGFMASLLLGLLLNVPFRSLEFLMAVPAMNSLAPDWGHTLFLVMAFDVIAMNFLYAACFVMALRSVPYFPRMLGIAWVIDISLQLAIAKTVAAQAAVPPQVVEALVGLLQGNVTKVLISAFIWLPYLLLSARVNVTYRNRLPLPR